ncbi:MAG: adenylosuccinate lyase [Acidobacteria bacterium]|nr:MAG: adenylosuccinate lyase [Acidobacteriota bacterium]
MPTDSPQNPLYERYASPEMARIFSSGHRFRIWRRLWITLAESERELGLPITAEQIDALRKTAGDADLERVAEIERRTRHDVVAHIRHYAEQADRVHEGAGGIIHLGATSAFITDNTDVLLIREALELLAGRLTATIGELAAFARRTRAIPTLAYTHFQPAQLTTVGKRACLWIQDFVMDLAEVRHRLSTLRCRGVKGTTGTQASFLTLFHGDGDKVRELDRRVAKKLGFAASFPVTGQTYSRKQDSQVLQTLAGLAETCHKFGTDLRLLQGVGELSEPFDAEQVGSSAMAYKRNPVRAERMCGLARQDAQGAGTKVILTHDPVAAVKDASAVYTDVWASMGQESEQQERLKAFKGFTVDSALMSHARQEAVFLHCLPAHRGEEVSAEVCDGPQSRIFDEAENRLHVQKAIMLWLMAGVGI